MRCGSIQGLHDVDSGEFEVGGFMESQAQTVPAPEKGTFLFKKGNSMSESKPPAATPKPEIKKPVSKLKAVAPEAAEPSKPKILIFGAPGVGKSWGSLDFPHVYYMDTEGGADLEHYTEKLKKSGGVYFGPDQGSQSMQAIIEEVKVLATEEHPYKTLVIDSISKVFNLEITAEAERLSDKGLKNEFAADKKPAVKLTGRLISWINKLDMNVVLIAHEKPLWLKGEQIGVTFDAHDKLAYELHLCLNIIKTGDTRRAIVKKTRLLQFPDASNFEWSYLEFANRYGKEVMEKKAGHLTLATPEQLTEAKRLLEIVRLSETDKQDKWLADHLEELSDIEAAKMEKIINHLKGKLK